jgi:hypothetical protein
MRQVEEEGTSNWHENARGELTEKGFDLLEGNVQTPKTNCCVLASVPRLVSEKVYPN